MINLHLRVRNATADDSRQISNLIFHESNTHRHLDWRTALEWLGSRNFWVLEDNGTVVAALACPEDPKDVGWIRLFSYHTHLSGPEAWYTLWNHAYADIFTNNPQAQIASIVMKQWFQSMLVESNFEPRLNIVLLELHSEDYRPHFEVPKVRIRLMSESDLLAVEKLDHDAFGPFWHNSYDSLQRARGQSFYSSVAEDEMGIIGYQISTGNPFGAHLARLGVRPDAQGRGVASALVHDLIQRAGALQSGRLSVNTQDDNIASLNLYKKLGFKLTGEYYPVFVRSLG